MASRLHLQYMYTGFTHMDGAMRRMLPRFRPITGVQQRVIPVLRCFHSSVAPALAPTLAPTHSGFCDWTQDVDDNFDWDMTTRVVKAPPQATLDQAPDQAMGAAGGHIHLSIDTLRPTIKQRVHRCICSHHEHSSIGCGLFVDYHIHVRRRHWHTHG
jgi:hypothetical protein